MALCQEIPVFDGPEYDIRLERPDGSLVRKLYMSGDGDPCSEMTWSPDGRTLAVLTGDVARVKFIDIAWALDHPSTQTSYSYSRQVDLWSRVLTRERQEQERLIVHGRELRFVAPLTVELQLCPYSTDARRRDGKIKCAEAPAIHRFDVPLPVGTRHRDG